MSQQTREEVAERLASLFLAASSAGARCVRDKGWPLTVSAEQMVIERNQQNPDAWSGSSKQVERSILAEQLDVPTHLLAPLLSPEVSELAAQCAIDIVALPDSNLPFWSPFLSRGWLLIRSLAEGSPEYCAYDANPGEWALHHLVLPALDYHLTALPGIDVVDEQSAQRFAEDVLQVATSRDLSYRLSVPLAGVIAKGIQDDSIRQLSDVEQGTLFQEWGLEKLRAGVMLTLPLTELVLTFSTPRDGHNPDVREDVETWLCAFQLHDYRIAGNVARFEASPSWRTIGIQRFPLTLPPMTDKWSVLTATELQEINESAAKLSRYSVAEPRSGHDLAFHRFHLGAARRSNIDAVLDFVIALESLLLPYDENARHGDLGYRFRVWSCVS